MWGFSRSDKSVLITGCSHGGIGYALSEEFARRGCKVFATARKPERMAGLKELGCTLLQLDTTSQESIDAAVEQVLRDLPDGPDILINNAGAAMRGPVLDCPVSEARDLLEVNYFGTVAMTRALAPRMIRRRSGTIVNVGSVAGFWAAPFMGHYSASKAAVHSLSDSLRLELAPFNVHVVHAAPGFVKTEIFNKAESAGHIIINSAGPYRPVLSDMEASVFQTIGQFPTAVKPFAKRFVSMALSRRPPALYLDGRWSLSSYLVGAFVPTRLLDAFSYVFFGPWKLTTWYPWAPSLAEAGPMQALLGLRPEEPRPASSALHGDDSVRITGDDHPQAVSAPAGVGAPGADVAGMVRRRGKAAAAAVAAGPIGGAPNKPEENVFA